MRQITQKAVTAFLNDRDFNRDNTQVIKTPFDTRMYLHGNQIAVKNKKTNKIHISNSGWNTNTTKERLNGLLEMMDKSKDKIYQSDFQWYWKNGEMFPYDEFIEI